MAKQKLKRKPVSTIPTTRVAVIIITDEREILLVRHRKGSKLYWVLPGGRLEYGETFNECAVRELKEETGLDVQVEKPVFLSEAIAPDRSRHIINVYLSGKIVGGQLKVGDEPVLDGVEFIKLADVGKLTLFPPIAKTLVDSAKSGFDQQVKYLGNLWV